MLLGTGTEHLSGIGTARHKGEQELMLVSSSLTTSLPLGRLVVNNTSLLAGGVLSAWNWSLL